MPEEKEEEVVKSEEETIAEAQQILEARNREIVEACSKELTEVLEKHGCDLDVAMIVATQGNKPIVNIIVKPEQPTQ